MSVQRMGAIAIGSNSVRMLTANLDDTLSNPLRGRVETALFLSMDDKRQFSEAGMERVARAVQKLAQEALDAGAQELRLIATSAMRDAINRNELDFYVASCSPVLINRIISGEEEAQLSFFAATCIPPREGLQGMVDIGGGSTEVALGTAEGGIHFARSLQLGAARMLKHVEIVDIASMEAALARARRMISDGLPPLSEKPEGWGMVGGTGSTLAAMMLGLPLPLQVPDGSLLPQEAVREWLRRLAPMSAEERLKIPGLPATRLKILPTGLAILLSLMERLEIQGIRVSLRNNLDGYLYRLYKSPREDQDAVE